MGAGRARRGGPARSTCASPSGVASNAANRVPSADSRTSGPDVAIGRSPARIGGLLPRSKHIRFRPSPASSSSARRVPPCAGGSHAYSAYLSWRCCRSLSRSCSPRASSSSWARSSASSSAGVCGAAGGLSSPARSCRRTAASGSPWLAHRATGARDWRRGWSGAPDMRPTPSGGGADAATVRAVRISGPSAVIATVCSTWTPRDRSTDRIVQPSRSMTIFGLPARNRARSR